MFSKWDNMRNFHKWNSISDVFWLFCVCVCCCCLKTKISAHFRTSAASSPNHLYWESIRDSHFHTFPWQPIPSPPLLPLPASLCGRNYHHFYLSRAFFFPFQISLALRFPCLPSHRVDQLRIRKLWDFNLDLYAVDGKKRMAFCRFYVKSVIFNKRELVLWVTCLDVKAGEKKYKSDDEARRQNLNKWLGQELPLETFFAQSW